MPEIQDLTNDGPPQNILKRKLKCDDNNNYVDPKRTHMATDIQGMKVFSFVFSLFYFVNHYLTDCNSLHPKRCSCHISTHAFAC